MKKIFGFLILLIMIFNSVPLFADAPSPLPDRTPVINFEGNLLDGENLPFDGVIDVEASYYTRLSREPADLAYREEFEEINVSKGVFYIPLLDGVPLDGTSFSVGSFSRISELYVDININGTTFIEGWPLGSKLVAIRSERANRADFLRLPFTLTNDQLPVHSARLITMGTVGEAYLASIPAVRITRGSFAQSRVPNLDASKVTSGQFEADAFESGISAHWFTEGELAPSFIPDEIMRLGPGEEREIDVLAGPVEDGRAVPIPAGYDRSQCSWAVSIANLDGSGGIDYLRVLTDSNGVVSCLWDNDSDTIHEPPRYSCNAQYLTICKR